MKRKNHRRGAGVLLALIIAAAAALTGCAGKPTSQSLAKTASEKMGEIKSASLEETLVMDASIGAEGMSVDLKLNMGISGDVIVDPYTAHLKMKMDLEAMGQSETVKSEVYAERDGDKLVTYTTDDGSNWVRSEEAMSEAALTGMLNFDLYNLIADGTVEAVLAEETQTIGDKEVYVLTLEMKGEQLEEAMASSVSAAGDAGALFKDVDLTGVTAPTTVYIDKKSGYPVRLEMDMSGLGATLLSSAMGMSGEDYSMDVREFTVRVDLSAFNTIDQIAIPDQARSAKEGADQDLLEGLTDVPTAPETDVKEETTDEGYTDEMKTGDRAELTMGDSHAVITKPEGFDELRYSDDYASADVYDNGAMTDIFYYLFENTTMDQYLDFTDASYMREDADYSNVKEGEIQSGTIGGHEAKWKKTSFDYSNLAFIKYEICMQAGGNNILSVEITCTNDAGTEQWFDEKALLENVLSHIEIK